MMSVNDCWMSHMIQAHVFFQSSRFEEEFPGRARSHVHFRKLPSQWRLNSRYLPSYFKISRALTTDGADRKFPRISSESVKSEEASFILTYDENMCAGED
jgi:hypothetical protein